MYGYLGFAVLFDKLAHVKGHAPHGIEIHPVLSIAKSG